MMAHTDWLFPIQAGMFCSTACVQRGLRHTILDRFREVTTELHFFLSLLWVITDKTQTLSCQLLLWQMLIGGEVVVGFPLYL